MTGGAQDSGVLLPCPFCGQTDNVAFDQVKADKYDVTCWDCGTGIALSYGPEANSREAAAAAWNTRATPAPAGWQPRIGEEVRVSEETAARWPDWRDTRLWVVGVSMDRNVSGTPTEGLNVCVSDEWPVTNRTGSFTDGFFINRPYAGDDLRPIPTAPAEGGV